MHYEVALTRTAFDNLKRYALSAQASRLEGRIAANRYEGSLAQRSMRALQEYYISHRGNKGRKILADSHHANKTMRQCLDAWMTRYNRRVAHREKLTYMHDQINERLKLIVWAEWKQYVLSKQLRKAQQATACLLYTSDAADE